MYKWGLVIYLICYLKIHFTKFLLQIRFIVDLCNYFIKISLFKKTYTKIWFIYLINNLCRHTITYKISQNSFTVTQ